MPPKKESERLLFFNLPSTSRGQVVARRERDESAAGGMVTERWLDALDYARSLPRRADSAMVSRRGAYSLGVFEADILEECIMKLIAPGGKPA